MESKIPIPTDNINKFYALFGLILFITSVLGVALVSSTTNEKIYQLIRDYHAIQTDNAEQVESPLAGVIEKLIEIQGSNKRFFLNVLHLTIIGSIWLMWHGFRQWRDVIQPKQDELLDLQILKLKQEVKSSERRSHWGE